MFSGHTKKPTRWIFYQQENNALIHSPARFGVSLSLDRHYTLVPFPLNQHFRETPASLCLPTKQLHILLQSVRMLLLSSGWHPWPRQYFQYHRTRVLSLIQNINLIRVLPAIVVIMTPTWRLFPTARLFNAIIGAVRKWNSTLFQKSHPVWKYSWQNNNIKNTWINVKKKHIWKYLRATKWLNGYDYVSGRWYENRDKQLRWLRDQ